MRLGSAPGQQLRQIRTSNELKQRYACAMAAAIENAANVKPSTLRVRRHRERRREGPCSLTVEMSKAGIEDAIARGMLKPDYGAWNVLDAWYADHLSDAALEWLVNNNVIKREQRNDAVAILRSISNWLERLGDDEKRR
jgi:hypothetical protein